MARLTRSILPLHRRRHSATRAHPKAGPGAAEAPPRQTRRTRAPHFRAGYLQSAEAVTTELPLPCGACAEAVTTLPLPCGFCAEAVTTLPLPCGFCADAVTMDELRAPSGLSAEAVTTDELRAPSGLSAEATATLPLPCGACRQTPSRWTSCARLPACRPKPSRWTNYVRPRACRQKRPRRYVALRSLRPTPSQLEELRAPSGLSAEAVVTLPLPCVGRGRSGHDVVAGALRGLAAGTGGESRSGNKHGDCEKSKFKGFHIRLRLVDVRPPSGTAAGTYRFARGFQQKPATHHRENAAEKHMITKS